MSVFVANAASRNYVVSSTDASVRHLRLSTPATGRSPGRAVVVKVSAAGGKGFSKKADLERSSRAEAKLPTKECVVPTVYFYT
jgi:hypothetical protein